MCCSPGARQRLKRSHFEYYLYTTYIGRNVLRVHLPSTAADSRHHGLSWRFIPIPHVGQADTARELRSTASSTSSLVKPGASMCSSCILLHMSCTHPDSGPAGYRALFGVFGTLTQSPAIGSPSLIFPELAPPGSSQFAASLSPHGTRCLVPMLECRPVFQFTSTNKYPLSGTLWPVRLLSCACLIGGNRSSRSGCSSSSFSGFHVIVFVSPGGKRNHIMSPKSLPKYASSSGPVTTMGQQFWL